MDDEFFPADFADGIDQVIGQLGVQVFQDIGRMPVKIVLQVFHFAGGDLDDEGVVPGAGITINDGLAHGVSPADKTGGLYS